MITRGEPTLEAAVASVRPYVAEVCLVYTGADAETSTRVAALADRFEWYQGCNFPDGAIRDFADARNRSIALATHPALLWLDSDDSLEGGEHIAELVARSMRVAGPVYWELPYEYGHDDDGRVTLTLARERLFCPTGAFEWQGPVHEVCRCIVGAPARLESSLVRIVHHRSKDAGKESSRRNRRILQDQIERDPKDSRARFYLAEALHDSGEPQQALSQFERYLNDEDGNEEQRAIAAMRMATIHAMRGEFDLAYARGLQAKEEREWAECYFTMARIYRALAERDAGKRDELRWWERAAHAVRIGLGLPVTRSSMWVNPMDRAYHAHDVLNVALAKLGDARGALDSAREALKAEPGDGRIAANALLYEAALCGQDSAKLEAAKQSVRQRAAQFTAAGHIGATVADAIAKSTGGGKLPCVGLDIVIACGDCFETWNPAIADRLGIGGSETAVVEIARRLAALGHRVRVFTSCGQDSFDDRVDYLTSDKLLQVSECDVLIAWRNAEYLAMVRAPVRYLWAHDTMPLNPSRWTLHLATRVLGLSEWHLEHMAEGGVPREKLTRTRNGVATQRFTGPTAPLDSHKVLYTSSPSRGLEPLLEAWPRIRRRRCRTQRSIASTASRSGSASRREPATGAGLSALRASPHGSRSSLPTASRCTAGSISSNWRTGCGAPRCGRTRAGKTAGRSSKPRASAPWKPRVPECVSWQPLAVRSRKRWAATSA